MFDFVRLDVAFIHAPSVYDFRKDTILFGPVSDVVPSSNVFEMYPVGITSIADRLERAGYNVQIVNVAYRMLRDPAYDPEQQIRRMNPRLWAIDLHWLPHAHGALALVDLIKKHHPDARVLMGGLSASYYHEELIQNPNVDFVIRGDSTEEPVLELVRRLRLGSPLESVPNLTWKRSNGTPVVNPLSHVPDHMDGADVPAYRFTMRMVFKYWNLRNTVPYLRWLEYPMTALLTARGCTGHCAICGGARSAYARICNRESPAFRSPERLAEDVRFITRFSRAPIFVIHDIRMGGMEYAYRLLDLLKAQRVENEVVIELFRPADDAFFERVHDALPRWSLEMTLESHDEELRRLNGKFPVTNEQVEKTIEAALAHGCNRLDIYFMAGIPHQTSESVLASMAYADRLLTQYGAGGKLKIYVAPLAPFLDPGSPAFENPEQFGYRVLVRTLEEHRRRLTSPTWSRILNYESLSMPPDELVATTYEASARLVQSKLAHGLMSQAEADKTLELIGHARRLVLALNEADLMPEPARTEALARLRAEAAAVNQGRIYDQTEFISWGQRTRQLKLLGLVGLMFELLWEELRLGFVRLGRRAYLWKKPR
ncbi:MAG: TIGR04190 family B12-binding domain/radical SAM domain protein [Mycobacterium leprae]